MDLRIGASDIHVPSEILELVVGFLADDRASILKTRLVCKILCQAATKQMIRKVSRPSEILTQGTLDIPDDAMSQRCHRVSPHAITVWTWLRPPEGAAQNRDFTQEFKDALCAPHKYEDDYGLPATGGRVSTCWGRMREDQSLVAIGMRKLSRECHCPYTYSH